MSQGGTAIGIRQQESVGEHRGKLLRELVRSGKSFSGRERNCCYLNTGNLHWANISAVSGLDLPDDGRGVAVSDWDHDGDLDLWVVNRSGPQLRFFQNDLEPRSGGSFVSFHLEGVHANRDAIGARVELHLNGPRSTFIKTVRAGDAYLSQSSKVVHFGIPAGVEIASATIRWPGGNVQQLPEVEAGHHYAIRESTPPRPWTPVDLTDQDASLLTSPIRANHPTNVTRAKGISPVSSRGRLFLTTPLLMPELRCQTFSGEELPLSEKGKPRLITLWSASCVPCIAELSHFVEQQVQLRDAQIDVVAVCVDSVNRNTSTLEATESPQQVLDRLEFSFRRGVADAPFLDTLQTVNNHLLDLHQPLPVPCSFLIDAAGRLSAIYKGPVSVDLVIRDVAQSQSTDEMRREYAGPFPGQWAGPPRSPRLLTLALSMLDAGLVDETLHFLTDQRAAFAADDELSILLFNLGQQMTLRKSHNQATQLYRQALNLNPKLGSAHYNLAVTYLQAGDETLALEHLEQTVALEPNSPDALLYLGTLLAKRGQLSRANELLEKAVQLRPTHAQTQFQLAMVAALRGALDQSISSYLTAANLDSGTYASPSRKSQFVAALELTFRSLKANRQTAPEVLTKWQTAIQRLRKE